MIFARRNARNGEYPLRKSFSFVAGGAVMLAMPAQANEQDVPAPAPPIFQAVIDCQTHVDPAERLACYDRTVGTMAAARMVRDLVVADRDTMREARRGLFGLALPSLKLFGGAIDEEMTAIEGVIDSVYSAKDDNSVFVLTDGARWKQIDGRPAYARKGDPIRIEKASLGSFFAKIGKGQNARVIRIQ
jgi:hypothetical protein